MRYIRPENLSSQPIEKDVQDRAASYAAVMRRAMSDSKYSLPEASLRLPFDRALFEKSRVLADRLAGPNLLYVINIGIGGSSLGARAVYEAVCGTLDGHNSFFPKIIFADTCSPELLADLTGILIEETETKESFLLVISSKSGTTTETMVNASSLVSDLEKKYGSVSDRIVCITDEGSPLWQEAKKQAFHLLPIPKMVGGRYSVFSPVGIFPLLAVGVEAEELVRGAEDVVSETVARGAESDAFRAAADILAQGTRGTAIFDMFVFHPELEALGKWYRQLFAESIGKDTAKDGTKTAHHLVPTASVGTADLHSVEQLYLADPDIFARTIVRINASHWGHDRTSGVRSFEDLAPGIAGHAPCQIMEAIYHGVKEAYRKRGISFAELELPDLSLRTIGALLQFEMCMVMHLANLLNINAFDQPNVEEYKNAVKAILENKT